MQNGLRVASPRLNKRRSVRKNNDGTGGVKIWLRSEIRLNQTQLDRLPEQAANLGYSQPIPDENNSNQSGYHFNQT